MNRQGEMLRALRAGRGLRELARSTSLSPGLLCDVERGRRRLSPESIVAVCEVIGCSDAATGLAIAGALDALDAVRAR